MSAYVCKPIYSLENKGTHGEWKKKGCMLCGGIGKKGPVLKNEIKWQYTAENKGKHKNTSNFTYVYKDIYIWYV